MQMLQKDFESIPLPVIGVVAPALLLSLNGNISINCDEEQQEQINELPNAEILQNNILDIIEAYSDF